MVTPSSTKRPARVRAPVKNAAKDTGVSVAVSVEDSVPEQSVAPAPITESIDDLVTATSQTEGTIYMTDALETAKNYAEETKVRFQSAFSEVNDKTKAAVEKTSKAFEELSELTKGNIEALVESGQVAAKGVEKVSQDAAEYGRKSFEKTSATLKSFAAVKSPAEFFQLQSELFTSAFDTLASETAKSSESVLKLAGDIAKPLSSRAAVVSEKFKSFTA